MCLNDEVYNKCQADLPEIRDINQKVTDDLIDDQICVDTEKVNLYLNESFMSSCFDKCLIECKSVNYEVGASSAAFPTDSFKNNIDIYFTQKLMNNSNYSRFINISEHEKKILLVNIFYKESR